MQRTITILLTEVGGDVRADVTVEPPIPFDERMTHRVEIVAQRVMSILHDCDVSVRVEHFTTE